MTSHEKPSGSEKLQVTIRKMEQMGTKKSIELWIQSFWKIGLAILTWILLMAMINFGIPKLNTGRVYESIDLPSTLLETRVERTVSNGTKGYLTYGPYITLNEGNYVLEMYYSADTDSNWIDVSSIELREPLYMEFLSKDQHVHRIDLSLAETVDKIEVRTWYDGEGMLSIDRLEIHTVREDLQMVQHALNVFLLLIIAYCCGYLFSKLNRKEKPEKERILWKFRVRKSIWVAVLISFTFFVAGPISLYVTNADEFWFPITQMLPGILILFVVVSALLTIVLSLFGGDWFLRVLSITFGIGIALYVQGNFLVADYGLLNGADVDWNAFGEWAVVNTFIWIACVLIPLCVLYFRRSWMKIAVSYGSALLVMVQAVALGGMLVTAGDLGGNTDYILTTENINVVSEKENIIVFLLDAFGAVYLDDLLDKNPEYQEKFEDFTYYRNASAAGSPTHIAMPAILTGYLYKDELSYADYVSQAFQYTPLYRTMVEYNYDVGIYTNARFVDKEQDEYISNIFYGGSQVSSQLKFLEYWMKFTAFRYFPHILKSPFLIYSGVFDELKTGNKGLESYSISDRAYLQLQEPLEFQSEKNAFRLYHVMGAHPPYSLDENAVIVGNSETTREQQIKGCFHIIENYIRQLKEKGVYDNSTIIIMADHGAGIDYNPIFMLKEKNAHRDFNVSVAPISHIDLLPTLLEILGENEAQIAPYGRSIFSVTENEMRDRYFYRDTPGANEVRHIVEYHSSGDVWNEAEWKETGVVYYGDAALALREYSFGTVLSFGEEATGNLYTTYGFIRINDTYTVTTDYHAEMRFLLAKKPKGDIQVELSVWCPFEPNGDMIIHANDLEVFDGQNVNGTIIFTVPKDIVEDQLNLQFQFPDAVDAGWHLYAFNFISICIDDLK